jgi:hypothetical protein
VAAEPGRAVVLHVWPPAPGETGTGALYSDDGDGYGDWSLDRFTVLWEGSRVVVRRRTEGARPRPELSVVVRGRRPERGVVLGD